VTPAKLASPQIYFSLAYPSELWRTHRNIPYFTDMKMKIFELGFLAGAFMLLV
jgi:hypothetical protein